MPWTAAKRAQAIQKLNARKKKATKQGQVDNSSLYAGSPMYYYCHLCGLVAAVLPEDHRERPPPHCGECQDMIDNRFDPEKNKFI